MTINSMRIYTRNGDQGTTGLANGTRLSKDDLRVELIGALDELNASIGVARVFTRTWIEPVSKIPRASVNALLLNIQDELFYIGALVAQASRVHFPLQQKILYWEKVIDGLDAQLPLLEHFILPGGSRVAALIHLSRAICRRSERLAVHFVNSHPGELPEGLIPYLNRLSDLLFVLARFVNKIRHAKEQTWPLET